MNDLTDTFVDLSSTQKYFKDHQIKKPYLTHLKMEKKTLSNYILRLPSSILSPVANSYDIVCMCISVNDLRVVLTTIFTYVYGTISCAHPTHIPCNSSNILFPPTRYDSYINPIDYVNNLISSLPRFYD